MVQSRGQCSCGSSQGVLVQLQPGISSPRGPRLFRRFVRLGTTLCEEEPAPLHRDSGFGAITFNKRRPERPTGVGSGTPNTDITNVYINESKVQLSGGSRTESTASVPPRFLWSFLLIWTFFIRLDHSQRVSRNAGWGARLNWMTLYHDVCYDNKNHLPHGTFYYQLQNNSHSFSSSTTKQDINFS